MGPYKASRATTLAPVATANRASPRTRRDDHGLVESVDPCKAECPLVQLLQPWRGKCYDLTIVLLVTSVRPDQLDQTRGLDQDLKAASPDVVLNVSVTCAPVSPCAVKLTSFKHLGLDSFHEGFLVGVAVALVQGVLDVLLKVLRLFVTDATETSLFLNGLPDTGRDACQVLTLTGDLSDHRLDRNGRDTFRFDHLKELQGHRLAAYLGHLVLDPSVELGDERRDQHGDQWFCN